MVAALAAPHRRGSGQTSGRRYMTRRFRFAVVTPTTGVNEILMQTLASVTRQSVAAEIDHWLVFDASPESVGTLPALFSDPPKKDGFRYRVLFNEGPRGPSAARNRALDAVQTEASEPETASADVVCFLDADDLWPSDYLQTLLDLYAAHQEIAAVSVPGYAFGGTTGGGRPALPLIPSGYLRFEQMVWNPIGCPSGFSVRWRGVARDVRFNETLRFCEDYHYYLQLFLAGCREFYRPADLGFGYRHSADQATRKPHPDAVEQSREALIKSLSAPPFDGLSRRQQRALHRHFNYRFDRLTRSGWQSLAETFSVTLLTPSWVMAQWRRWISKSFQP